MIPAITHAAIRDRPALQSPSAKLTPQPDQFAKCANDHGRTPARLLSGFSRKMMHANLGHLRAQPARPCQHLDVDEGASRAQLRDQAFDKLATVNLERTIDVANRNVEEQPRDP